MVTFLLTEYQSLFKLATLIETFTLIITIQIVRAAINRQCRCHGISGACQFQTCWDQLASFNEIASGIRNIYLKNAHLVGYNNLGSVEQPDIYLSKLNPSNVELRFGTSQSEYRANSGNRIESNELAYLYESPTYCEDQPEIKHVGTKGRECIPEVSSIATELDITLIAGQNRSFRLNHDLPGSCGYLCCGRGYYGELVLHVVKCDCRFKFCCKVECADCPRQRMQHYCS